MLIQEDVAQLREAYAPAALICSVIANVHRDPDKRHEPFLPADFMPGAKSEDDELREFAERVMRGETFAPPSKEQIEKFRQEFRDAQNPRAPKGGRMVDGTKGTAGEAPRRGVI